MGVLAGLPTLTEGDAVLSDAWWVRRAGHSANTPSRFPPDPSPRACEPHLLGSGSGRGSFTVFLSLLILALWPGGGHSVSVGGPRPVPEVPRSRGPAQPAAAKLEVDAVKRNQLERASAAGLRGKAVGGLWGKGTLTSGQQDEAVSHRELIHIPVTTQISAPPALDSDMSAVTEASMAVARLVGGGFSLSLRVDGSGSGPQASSLFFLFYSQQDSSI